MIVSNKIFLRKKRDFGDMFATVFTLLRRNFGVIVGSFLIVPGPFILLAAVAAAFMQNSIFGGMRDISQLFFNGGVTQYLSDMIANAAPWIVLLSLFSMLSFSFVRATMANFFVIYDSKLEGDSITVNEIARKSYKDGFRVFLGQLVFTFISLVPLIILAIPLGLLASIGSGAGVVLVVFLILFAGLAFFPQLMYIFSFATWFSMVKDKVFVFKAIGNVFKTISGNFWWTWVIMICTFLIIMILNAFVNIPMWIYSAFSGFSRMNPETFELSIAYVFFICFTQLGTNLVMLIADLMTGVSYYSFEEEKTGAGLTSRIDEIGKQESNPNYI